MAKIPETWLTPKWVIDALGEFDLDPCAAETQPWPTAKKHYTKYDDGLALPWSGRVWMNPPYNTKVNMWTRRLADHGNGVALVFVRSHRKWFIEDVLLRADATLFIEGRIVFYKPSGKPAGLSGKHPSALVAYGSKNAKALEGSGIAGSFLDLVAARESGTLSRLSGRSFGFK